MKIFKNRLIVIIAIVTFVTLFSKCSSNNTLVDDVDKNLDYFFISSNIFLSKLDTSSNEKIEKIVSLINAAKYEESLNIIINLENDFKNNFEVKNLKGICYAGLAKYEDSRKEFDECLELANKNNISKSIIFNNLGSLHIIIFELDNGRDYYSAIKINNKNSIMKICVQYNLARCFGEQGEINLEKQYFKKILKNLKLNFPEERKINYFSKIYLLSSDENILKNVKIINEMNKILTNLEDEMGENNPEIATLHNLIGHIYYIKKDYINSFESFQLALDIQKNSLPDGHFDFSYSYSNLFLCLANFKEFDLAKEYKYLSFKILLNYPNSYINFASHLNNVGAAYYKTKDYDMAMKYFLKAYYIYSLNNNMYTLSQMSLNNIRNCYIELNYDISKFEVWLEEQTRDMTKEKVYAEMEEILNGSDWT